MLNRQNLTCCDIWLNMRFKGQRLSNKNQLNNFRLAVFSRARQKTGFFVDLARDSGFRAVFRVKNLKIPIPGRATDSGTRRNPFINNMFLNFQFLKHYQRISTSCISRVVFPKSPILPKVSRTSPIYKLCTSTSFLI